MTKTSIPETPPLKISTDDKFIKGDGFSLDMANASYYPLVLIWDDKKTGRHWELKIQSKPKPKITIEGDKPERGEMAELILDCGNITYGLLDIFMVIAELHEKKHN